MPVRRWGVENPAGAAPARGFVGRAHLPRAPRGEEVGGLATEPLTPWGFLDLERAVAPGARERRALCAAVAVGPESPACAPAAGRGRRCAPPAGSARALVFGTTAAHRPRFTPRAKMLA